jgi:hypothetical protein
MAALSPCFSLSRPWDPPETLASNRIALTKQPNHRPTCIRNQPSISVQLSVQKTMKAGRSNTNNRAGRSGRGGRGASTPPITIKITTMATATARFTLSKGGFLSLQEDFLMGKAPLPTAQARAIMDPQRQRSILPVSTGTDIIQAPTHRMLLGTKHPRIRMASLLHLARELSLCPCYAAHLRLLRRKRRPDGTTTLRF